MNAPSLLKTLLVSAFALAAAGAAVAQGTIRGTGQESTQHAPMGETGTPHGHPGVMQGSGGGMDMSGRTMGSSRGIANPSLGTGQESTRHTPMGETGIPHGHVDARGTVPDTSRMGAARNPELSDAGQESTHHTPMGETGTPHSHYR